jgi:predicted RNA-binding protein YlxR (DUF448 family)
VRTCVACRAEAGKRDLIRLVRRQDGRVAVDPTGRAPGRGAYLHHDPGCLDLARRRRALERALKASVAEEVWVQLAGQLRSRVPCLLEGEGEGTDHAP